MYDNMYILDCIKPYYEKISIKADLFWNINVPIGTIRSDFS